MAEVKAGKGALLKLAVLVALFAGGFLLARFTPLGNYLNGDGVQTAIDFLRGSKLAPMIFVTAYATLTALAVPGAILTLAGGAVFGVFWGVIFNSIAANIGANAAFLIARSLGRDGVRGLMGEESEALRKMDDVVGRHGFRGLLTLRLIPLVPFNALNFGSGLMPLRWSTYAAATMIGIFPGTVVYTFFADALLQGSQDASRGALVRVAIAGALLILMSFLPQILRRLNIQLPGAGVGAASLVLLGAAGATAQQPGDLVDHGAFTSVLREVVVDAGVDYARLQDRAPALDAYLEQLARVSPEALEGAGTNELLAFWINAYNACMLDRVIEHYPIERAGGLTRLKNAVAGRPANSVWQIPDVFTAPHCTVAGEERSQDQIEHEIIRPMGDPRIHFAVNCAALSCPPLVADAYEGARLDDQLDARVRAFIDAPAHFVLDDGVLRVNKVLDWFGDDFGGPEGVKAFFAGYLAGDARAMLEDDGTRVEYFEYDWTLNDSGS